MTQGIHDGQIPREIDAETGLPIGPRCKFLPHLTEIPTTFDRDSYGT